MFVPRLHCKRIAGKAQAIVQELRRLAANPEAAAAATPAAAAAAPAAAAVPDPPPAPPSSSPPSIPLAALVPIAAPSAAKGGQIPAMDKGGAMCKTGTGTAAGQHREIKTRVLPGSHGNADSASFQAAADSPRGASHATQGVDAARAGAASAAGAAQASAKHASVHGDGTISASDSDAAVAVKEETQKEAQRPPVPVRQKAAKETAPGRKQAPTKASAAMPDNAGQLQSQRRAALEATPTAVQRVAVFGVNILVLVKEGNRRPMGLEVRCKQVCACPCFLPSHAGGTCVASMPWTRTSGCSGLRTHKRTDVY